MTLDREQILKAQQTAQSMSDEDKGKARNAIRDALEKNREMMKPPVDAEDTFTTSDGMEIKLKWVNPMLMERVRASVRFPDPPMYEAKTMGGNIEEWPLDEESAKENPKDQARWNYYQKKLQETAELQSDRIMRVVLGEGTEFTPPDNGWEERDELYGLEVPESDSAKKIHYLRTHLDPSDTVELMSAIMELAGVNEEMIKEAESSFRDQVRDTEGQAGSVDGPGGHTGGT